MRCADGEFRTIRVSPPVDQIAITVVLGALVIETVADLMADHRADSAVVGGIVGVGVEERWLQDRGGEDDLIHTRVVVRVDRLWGHKPFIAVDRATKFGHFAVKLHLRTTNNVAVQIIS